MSESLPTVRDLAQMIDHSLLHPTMTDQDIAEGCRISAKYEVATACVKPYAVEMAAEVLLDSSVEVSTVAGFPHGNSTIDIKCREAEDAVNHGASEVDMVVNVGNVLGGDWNYVIRELESVHTTVRDAGGILKMIFENDFLEDEHIIRLTEIASDVGVAFIKTSTGYGFVKRENGMYTYYGAQDHHLKLMRKHADINVQIKAAGGIRTLDDLLRVRDLGVTRIGATATESILEAAMDRGFE